MDPNKKRSKIDGDIDDIIPETIYPVIDTDLGRDNVENDLPDADLQDLKQIPPNNKKR